MNNGRNDAAGTNGTNGTTPELAGFVDMIHNKPSNAEMQGTGETAAMPTEATTSEMSSTTRYGEEMIRLLNESKGSEVHSVNPRVKRWPLVLAALGFILISLALLLVGPGVYVVTLLADGWQWVIVFLYYAFYLTAAVGVASVVGGLLYLAAFISAFRQKSRSLANISIMMGGNIVGLAVLWLSGYEVIKVDEMIMAIVMTLCVLVPCVALAALHQSRKKNASVGLRWASAKMRTTAAVMMVLILVVAGVSGVMLAEWWQTYEGLTNGRDQHQEVIEKPELDFDFDESEGGEDSEDDGSESEEGGLGEPEMPGLDETEPDQDTQGQPLPDEMPQEAAQGEPEPPVADPGTTDVPNEALPGIDL